MFYVNYTILKSQLPEHETIHTYMYICVYSYIWVLLLLLLLFLRERRVTDYTGKEPSHISKSLIKAHVDLPCLGPDKPGSDQKQQGAHPRRRWQGAPITIPSEEYR